MDQGLAEELEIILEEGKEIDISLERSEDIDLVNTAFITEENENDAENVRELLKVDQVFESREAVEAFVEQLSKELNTVFVVRTSSLALGTSLVYCCKHGKKRKSRSQGKKPIQSTVRKNCPVHLTFYARKNGQVVLKSFDLDHENHPVSQEVYKQDTAKIDEKASNIIEDMLTHGRCKLANIKNSLTAKGYSVSTDQIRYASLLTVHIKNKTKGRKLPSRLQNNTTQFQISH